MLFMKAKNFRFVMVVVGLMLICMSVSGMGQEKPHYGGTLRIAMPGDPSTLDGQITTGTIVTGISFHIFETLFLYKSDYTPIPWLVESEEKSEDGTMVTFHLRKGVLFHNGEELDSGDVVASLKRWGKYGSHGPTLFEYVDEVTAVDKYTVQIKFTEPYGPLESVLAYPNGGCFIYLQEVAETVGGNPISPDQAIGTGPYRLAEWKPGDHLRLIRFKGYHEDWTGEGMAYLDELLYIPVPEVQTRIAGLLSGEFDYAMDIPADFHDQLVADPRVKAHKALAWFGAIMLNTKEGILANRTMRQAILATLDMEPILQAAWGKQYILDGAQSVPESRWYTKAGTELYNQADPEKGRRLAEQAGYHGEPIRLMATTSYQYMYNMALVVTDQLRKAGFNVDFQIYDWATVLVRRENPALWDMFITAHFLKPDPIFAAENTPYYPCWWSNPRQIEILRALKTTLDFEKRYALWEELQTLFYEDVPWIKVGTHYTWFYASPKVRGLEEPRYPPITDIFTFVWLEK